MKEEDTLRWFYKQVLMGDRVDNIPGLKGVGDKKADKILQMRLKREICLRESLRHTMVILKTNGDGSAIMDKTKGKRDVATPKLST